MVEVSETADLRRQLAEHGVGAGTLDRQRSELVADVLELDLVVADAVLEVGKVGFCRRQHELVGAVAEHDAVLVDETALVAPDRVLRLPGLTRANVPGEHACQVALGIRPGDPVLVQRRRVEHADRIADRDVLPLLGHLVLVDDQVAGPVAPQRRLVGGRDTRVERRLAQHLLKVPRCWTLAQQWPKVMAMARLSPDDRRQAIVDATLAVARRQGLGATTVRDVAAEMGTSSGLIHHYFESMDDVLAAAFEQAAGGDLARARQRIAAESDPIAQLDQFIESYAPAQSDWTMQLWLDAWAEAARRPALQRVSRPAQP